MHKDASSTDKKAKDFGGRTGYKLLYIHTYKAKCLKSSVGEEMKNTTDASGTNMLQI